MRKIMFGLLSIGLLAGCSSDEQIAVPQEKAPQAISFKNSFIDNMTRANEELTTANLQDFSVYGYSRVDATTNPATIFDGDVVSKDATTGAWTYANTQYWEAGKDYVFHAVGPYTSKDWGYTLNTADPELSDITFTNNGENDLIYAKQIVSDVNLSTIGAVQLTFRHLLSRAAFQFTNGFKNDGVELEIVGLTINKAKNKGTYHIAKEKGDNARAESWTIDADDPTVNISYGEFGKIKMGVNGTSEYMYLIPTTGVGYDVTFSINYYQNTTLASTYHHTITLPSLTYEINSSYLFTATIDNTNVDPNNVQKPIEFSVVEIKDWAEKTQDITPKPATTTP